ncbi:MAG: sugar transferase [Pyrinomonadaceae bacterium]|nr:sugar transferase [Pyrinomonadaceae bacterium]
MKFNKRKTRVLLIVSYRILDIWALTIALWFAFLYGAPQGIDYIYNAVLFPDYDSTTFFVGVLTSWAFCLSSFWLYRSKRLATWNEETFEVMQSVAFCTLILATMILLAEWHVVPKRFLLIFSIISFVLLLGIRAVKRQILHKFRLYGRNLRSVVIIGSGRRGLEVEKLIKQHPETGYNLIGFVDDEVSEKVLGNLSQIPQILNENVIDEVIICLPIKTFYNEMESIAKAAEEQGVTVRVYSDLFNLRLAKAELGELGAAPMLSLYTGPQTDWRMFVKNLIDFTGASALLLMLSPLLFTIALLIRLTSKGPAIFVQERIGFNKHSFKMYKFRTMVTNAEAMLAKLETQNEADGPVFKMKHDPRITPLGRFLRKTSLDELPQLFNVLLGDLSLVGPRPLPLRDVKNFDEYYFNRRFSIKPGITCVWQISGRSETSFDKWILQDLEYIDKWSLKLDFKILLKTLPAVMRGSGAM